ncbi:ribbon-helix-helix protein, CopG family [Heliobacterium undosum]|uniref:Helix-turn-helix domain protein, copg family, putative n=2 Tax=Heliomicrobium TaxID=2831443 RepID=B0TE83_HELMI|nr:MULTISPECIES: ribbon-helix-helix protein, CopG family [Heliomicrobium]ABZ84278.1 helix-turn-helix domain protein, copg family, putative [Heliomicrobium modesticaldum Ice1]MZP29901.1 ribbon-helix-helix protein, CopG family [Heliomicrobium undosum]
MPELKRIQVTLPESLLDELDRVLMAEKMNRSQLIREAVNLYMSEHKRKVLRDQMRRGYAEMARINLELALEGFVAEVDVERLYEARLAR